MLNFLFGQPRPALGARLNALRATPASAMGNYTYCLDTPSFRQSTICSIVEAGDVAGACLLRMTPAPQGGSDYFFPYAGNASSIAVPANVPPGTIAITTEMTGCALEVRYQHQNGTYVFYHDRNGQGMPALTAQETRVFRMSDSTYWSVAEQGASWPTSTPTYQFLCVFDGYLWQVGCYCIVRSTGTGSGPSGTVVRLGQSVMGGHVGFFHRRRSLIFP